MIDMDLSYTSHLRGGPRLSLPPCLQVPLKTLKAGAYPLPKPSPLAPLPAAIQVVSQAAVVASHGLEVDRLVIYGDTTGWHAHLSLASKSLRGIRARKLADAIMPEYLMAGVVSNTMLLGVSRADLSPCWKEALYAVEEAGGSLRAVSERVELLIRRLTDFLDDRRGRLFRAAYELLQYPAKFDLPRITHTMHGEYFRTLLDERMNP